MNEAEKMPQIEAEAPASDLASGEETKRSTLLHLQEEDKRLRKLMARGYEAPAGMSDEEVETQIGEKGFEDDDVYKSTLLEIKDILDKELKDPKALFQTEGPDRARTITGQLEKLWEKFKGTKRAQAEQEFNRVSLAREKAESEVARLKQIKKTETDTSKPE